MGPFLHANVDYLKVLDCPMITLISIFGFELIFISILLNGLLLFKKAPMNIHSTP
jgi:hypothetical protein